MIHEWLVNSEGWNHFIDQLWELQKITTEYKMGELTNLLPQENTGVRYNVEQIAIP